MKNLDIIKANRRASRELEIENSSGWKQMNKVYMSKKNYTRKVKHKISFEL